MVYKDASPWAQNHFATKAKYFLQKPKKLFYIMDYPVPLCQKQLCK